MPSVNLDLVPSIYACVDKALARGSVRSRQEHCPMGSV
jgi:hypothetical protein